MLKRGSRRSSNSPVQAATPTVDEDDSEELIVPESDSILSVADLSIVMLDEEEDEDEDEDTQGGQVLSRGSGRRVDKPRAPKTRAFGGRVQTAVLFDEELPPDQVFRRLSIPTPVVRPTRASGSGPRGSAAKRDVYLPNDHLLDSSDEEEEDSDAEVPKRKTTSALFSGTKERRASFKLGLNRSATKLPQQTVPRKPLPPRAEKKEDAGAAARRLFQEWVDELKATVEQRMDPVPETADELMEVAETVDQLRAEMRTEGRRLFEECCQANPPEMREEFKAMVADFQWFMKEQKRIIGELLEDFP